MIFGSQQVNAVSDPLLQFQSAFAWAAEETACTASCNLKDCRLALLEKSRLFSCANESDLVSGVRLLRLPRQSFEYL